MKLLGTNEVCEILGISKPTLYRWNNLSDDNSQSIENWLDQKKISLIDSKIQGLSKMIKESSPKDFSKPLLQILQKNEIEEPSPKNFPKPFKIGRAYKWRKDEIEEWLETMRVKK